MAVTTWRGRELPDGLSVKAAEAAEQMVVEYSDPYIRNTKYGIAHDVVIQMYQVMCGERDAAVQHQLRAALREAIALLDGTGARLTYEAAERRDALVAIANGQGT